MADLPSVLLAPDDACCGACLLELNEAADSKEASVASRASARLRLRSKNIAALEGCRHLFHLSCIRVWSQVENSCPQCRSRFHRFAEYSAATGQRLRLCEVEDRNQETSSDEVRCDVCGRGDHEHQLLLCDGRGGRCPGACHTYCDGLRRVPRGRWLCTACRGPRPAAPSRATQATQASQAAGVTRRQEVSEVAEPRARAERVKPNLEMMAQATPQAPRFKLRAAHASVAIDLDDEAPAPSSTQSRYHMLLLPAELEECAEQVRKFASTYLLCERNMPLAARTLERIWQLSQVGDRPRLLAEEQLRASQQLLAIARDSFELFWQQPSNPDDDDPCGLRCLRTKVKPQLCVRYLGQRGKRGRIRPSDIVRCELQSRRRLLELWQAQGLELGAQGLELPVEEIPATEPQQADLPRARAAAVADHIVAEVPKLVGMDLINALKAEAWYRDQAVHVSQTGARAARLAKPEAVLEPLLKEVLLETLKCEEDLLLYSHQAEAIDAILLRKQDVVVSTSTGSGKSLVYLMAIFQALLCQEDATAILIFPTKALAQDQLRSISDMAEKLIARGVPKEKLSVACLDGDTSAVERLRVRQEAKVVLTNPDMLHSHVLPQHIEYSRLLLNASYIVLDEVHVYRGAFGANVCSVLRRLRRLASERLQFVACSATVANPGQHLERLVGRKDPHVVVQDGSPSGGHIYVMWNPVQGEEPSAKRMKTEAQEVNQEDGAPQVLGAGGGLASPIVEVTRLLAWLVSRDVSVLAFCKWRSLVEIVLQDVKDALAASEVPELSSRVVSYRAGYPPSLRRQLERQIFHRQVLGVACTNALELGIDIGRLDCTISLGFPGSVASLRQQFGRAGRAGRLGLSFYVAFEDPTDQHFMRQPRQLLARRPESVALAPCNVAVMRQHLPCAAAERPLQAADARFWQHDGETDAWDAAVQHCLSHATLERVDGELLPAKSWAVRRGPHRAVSIRAVEDHFEVFEEVEPRADDHCDDGGFLSQPRRSLGPAESTTRKLDEIEISKAFYSLHPGAVYRYRGSEYQVVDLDLRRRRATVKRTPPLPYYTRAFDSTVIRLQTRERFAQSGEAKVFLGAMELESRVKSFKRFWKSRGQGEFQEAEVEVNLPSWGYTSRGIWFEDPLGVAKPEPVPGGIPEWTWGCGWAGAHAAMHAMLRVFPLFVLADRQDLDAACVDEHGAPPLDRPRLMIFDAKDGGLGLCDAAFEYGFAILREARHLVEECPCENGCPNCIIDSHCREYNRLLSKRGALEWLQSLEAGQPAT